MVYICTFCQSEFELELIEFDLLVLKEHVFLCELEHQDIIPDAHGVKFHDPANEECTRASLTLYDGSVITIKVFPKIIVVNWPDHNIGFYPQFKQALAAMKSYLQ